MAIKRNAIVWASFLVHHGVEGMHWYERRYQPYPSDWTGPGKFVGKEEPGLLSQKRKGDDSWYRGTRIGRIINAYSDAYDRGKWDNSRALAAKRMRSDMDKLANGVAKGTAHVQTLKAMASADPYGQFRNRSYKEEMQDSLKRLESANYEQRVMRTAYSELIRSTDWRKVSDGSDIEGYFKKRASVGEPSGQFYAEEKDLAWRNQEAINKGKKEIEKILTSKASSYPVIDYENVIYEMNKVHDVHQSPWRYK